MLLLRALGLLALLFLGGLAVAWIVTRDPRYLRLAARIAQTALVVAVAFGLLYLFERVLLFL